MSSTRVDSAAFEMALLRSEKLRILCILGFVLFFEVVYAVRIFFLGSLVPRWGLLAFPVFGIYEILILLAVRRALAEERELPASLWMFNIVLEMCMPALALTFLIGPRLPNAWAPLASPFVLTFFPFIILSTLRLNPRICRLAGIVATVGYFAAAYYRGWRLSFEGASRSSVTQSAVVVYGVIILASGFIAGAVAGEIRKYLQAALQEAETRQQLQQVQHDLDIARSIQQSLLPRVRPRIAGFEIAGWNLSADATGGDYFDWKQLSDGRLVVTLADVTGHGIGPAMLASVCRAYSRASFDGQHGLTTTVQRINEALTADLTQGRFATFVAVICKADDNQVELLSAGQGPLFLYSSSTDTFQEIPPQSIPLGLMPELNASAPALLTLRPGDLLLLITDGFFEWENDSGEAFGMERAADTIRRAKRLPPEEIIAELYNSILAFSNGTRQKDDLTAVVIKRIPNVSATDTLLPCVVTATACSAL
jgi:serine phosphatase RsbU (regulator of sigma subunit)